MLENTTQKITYIGKKPVKKDTVAGTGAIWNGFGDTQEIMHGPAVKLLQHPDVWVTKEKFEKLYQVKSNKQEQKAPETQWLSSVKASETENSGGDSKSEVDQSEPEGDKDEQPGAENESGEGTSNQDDVKGGPNRSSVVVNAILSLDKTNPEHFSAQTGNPIIAAVRNAAGDETIALKEVNAAWKVLSAPKAN